MLCLLTAIVTTTAHTTVITATPQQYPQQPVAPVQTPGYQYPPYNATPVQPGYGTHPMVQSYGTQPTPTAVPYQGQPYTVGPPPTYQEASKCTSMMQISHSTTSQRCSVWLRSADCGGYLSTVNPYECSGSAAHPGSMWAVAWGERHRV